MLTEKEIIQCVNSVIQSGPGRETACYESDSERLSIDGIRILFTTDEFSSEDRMPEWDPFTLGWNIAAGAITDILASGGIPLYYAHALTASVNWDRGYLLKLCTGIRDLLEAYSVTFAGGDSGLSEEFRCTASVIGKPSGCFLSRKGAAPGDGIYITGKVGGGNLNAALSLYGIGEKKLLRHLGRVVRCKVRVREAETVRKFASSCIDTSDGVFNALNTVADLNGTGYYIEAIPYLRKGILAARLLSLPAELLLMGECGEYELLFTVDREIEKAFLTECIEKKLEITRIGKVLENRSEKIIAFGKKMVNTDGFTIRGRDFGDVKEYLSCLKEWIEKCRKE